MRPVRHALINSVRAPVDRVFALLTDPQRIAQWLPGCDGVQSQGPLKKGARFTARFGARQTEFEIVDFTPPTTFAWAERGQRKGWKTFFRLDAGAGATALTIRDGWTPRSLPGRPGGRVFETSRGPRQLQARVGNRTAMLPA